jgi:hypothetical protein
MSNMRGPGVWTRGLAADVDKPSGSDRIGSSVAYLAAFASASKLRLV